MCLLVDTFKGLTLPVVTLQVQFLGRCNYSLWLGGFSPGSILYESPLLLIISMTILQLRLFAHPKDVWSVSVCTLSFYNSDIVFSRIGSLRMTIKKRAIAVLSWGNGISNLNNRNHRLALRASLFYWFEKKFWCSCLNKSYDIYPRYTRIQWFQGGGRLVVGCVVIFFCAWLLPVRAVLEFFVTEVGDFYCWIVELWE